MSEFENLLNKLLEQRPELSRADIEELIQQKKERIGAGYLTDQGALFLIAADLGVSLNEPLKVEMGLKDLYIGAKEISLKTRMLNISPPRQFSRKDGTPSFLRTMTVFDGDATASVKLWDEKANLPALNELKPGDMIKIIKAYVKSDLNGSPTINVGSGASIEIAEDDSEIPNIDAITKDIGAVTEGQKDLVVKGTIDGPISSMEFTNARGQPGKALRMRLKGSDGRSIRVVLWGKDESDIPSSIAAGAQARLLGVRTKMGNQGELEIHGNEGTIIEIEGTRQTEPVIVRIISSSQTESGRTLLLAVDQNRELYNITDTASLTSEFSEGDVIECMPSKLFGNSVILDENSFVRKIDDDQSIPKTADIRTKISDIKPGGTYCIEAIILKIPDTREIQTRTGENIPLAEMFVEDDSGQIWVKGWRNQSRLIAGHTVGEIVSITGVNAKAGLEGRTELSLTSFSSLKKKN